MPDQVPVVGQGTWQMGERRRQVDEVAALRAGIARGLTHIDTAELYGGAEDLIAEVIRGMPRRDLFIVSKVLPSNADRGGTLRACEKSLKRLGTDYLDVYLLHWRGSVPLAETLGALEELVDQGKIRALGVSNFDVADLEEARPLLRKHPIVCNQVMYHLGERHIDADLVAYCAQRDIAVVGYSPSDTGDFRRPRAPAAACSPRSRPAITPRPDRSRSRSWFAPRRCSRSRRRGTSRTPRRTPAPSSFR